MIIRLDAICAGSRNPFCNSAIAASITSASAGASAGVAIRCVSPPNGYSAARGMSSAPRGVSSVRARVAGLRPGMWSRTQPKRRE